MASRLKILAVVYATLFFFPYGYAKDHTDREKQLKAVYLVHFAELTQWPEVPAHQEQFTICVLGNRLISEYLREFEAEMISGKPLSVRHLETIDHLQGCRIIYLQGNKQNLLTSVIESLGQQPVLLVGDSRDFAVQGGGIGFHILENKIKLKI